MMNAAKVRKVIATCPHCFNTIKNEFPQFGGAYEIAYFDGSEFQKLSTRP